MNKGQGALEYLIIVAAVLGITAVVVSFLSGAFASQKETASVSECKDAAGKCSNALVTSYNASCGYCEPACEGLDIPTGNATELCKQGKPQKIHR